MVLVCGYYNLDLNMLHLCNNVCVSRSVFVSMILSTTMCATM